MAGKGDMEQAQLATAAWDAATFTRSAFTALNTQPSLAEAALWIPFLAGVSELIGQAYILASRRIAAGRAIISLALTGAIHVTAVIVWALAAFLFLELDRQGSDTLLSLLGAISLGYAPRLLSILTIAPFYGSMLGRALDAWAMACVGWGVWVVTGGPVAPALGCAALGWLASLMARHFGGVLLSPSLRSLGLATAGMRDV
ncbi:MAG: hypothetical protein K2P58_13350 [Hyphomonadaceae bacterium]|nr:hypothetical protein [Hyphomonadaceae bacterium]